MKQLSDQTPHITQQFQHLADVAGPPKEKPLGSPVFSWDLRTAPFKTPGR